MFQRIWNFLFVGRAAVWTALFTGILTVFTYMMYDVSKTTNDTSRSSERAFITFAGPGLGMRLVGGPTVNPKAEWAGQQMFFNFVNSGNTPARSVVIQMGVHDWPEDLPKGYQFPLDDDKIEATIGPKAQYSTDRNITKSMLEQNWHGKARIFIWGTVIYRDIFPNDAERLTEFCAELTHVTIGWLPSPKPPATPPNDINDPQVGIAALQWQSCKQHNCYDEDCYDYPVRIKDMR
jgi:hypothetical protein